MARCYLTGVGIALDEAFVLDLSVAHRVMRDLRERLATLERLTSNLGEKDRVTIHQRGGAGTRERQDRRVVSKTVATALSEACADAELFVAWQVWRMRGRALTLSMLRQHPDYGTQLRRLDDTKMAEIFDLAGEVVRRLTPGQPLTPELRDAVTAGVCAKLADHSAEEIVAVLRRRAVSPENLHDLGVPAHLEPALREVLQKRRDDWGDGE
jgi:hypothetical protein